METPQSNDNTKEKTVSVTQKCTECLAEIPKKAKKCSHCGSKQKKSFSLGRVVLATFLIVLFLIIIGSMDSDTSTSTVISTDSINEITNQAEPVDSGVPREYISALNKADSYANTMHMSKSGLYDQLTSQYGEQFSAAAAQYAIDNVNADWKANALEKARSYQDSMNMSPAAIHDQLTSEYGEKFTKSEADYAIQNLNN